MKLHAHYNPVVSVTGHVTNPTNDYGALMHALVTKGPQALERSESRFVRPLQLI